ncbi:extracellular solute-binding protein [Halalkalibacterium halodurans]|uniref:ABC transporter substrate-binding protein n=1 Tax=Halalkalibacterium halodurans TaxID=86665 RepID=UPI0010689617|nr:ABC transporter substrate-binding protein [Halalkalibacterium halodurans]MDY7224154.1 ABC transporter substrate-binding protein [Halalkalibacterium halodurans]MDY7243439.1 ABC transporter substrate-binding protein [Halalkalibacterium halodurans]TES56777.1 extracellular solute-binding protein [Halalkalibacterium halodurans]
MRKRLAVCLLIMALMVGVIACSNSTGSQEGDGEGAHEFHREGLPIVDEKVTLKFVSPKAPLAPDFNEMEIIQSLEEMTNVHIAWDNIPGDGYEERKNLMLASNDLPDAFYNAEFSDHEIVKYGQAGTIIPLEDLIEEYAPNLQAIFEQRPELKSMVTAPDGHIYSLPKAEEMGLAAVPNFTSINKAWLDELGLEMPTTLDELGDVLRAFRDEDPNGTGKKDVIPFSFMHNHWTGNFGDMFAAFGIPDNVDHRIVRDGNVIFTAVQPEYKEAIAYFHDWVDEGLIDPEAFTHDVSQYFAKGKTNPPTLGAYIWWETEEIVGPERADDYVLLPPLEGPNGHQMVGRSNYSEYDRGAFVITSANKHPEITMRWVDQLYDPKMSAQISWGPIGIIYEEDEKGMLVNKELDEGVAMGELRQKVAPNGPTVVLAEHFGTVVDMEPRAKQRLNDIEEVYAPYLVEENYPDIFFTEEELDRINRLEMEILDFVNQQQALWLLNGGVEEEWDSYVNQLERMGLDELMEIYQEGLDRFNENLSQ